MFVKIILILILLCYGVCHPLKKFNDFHKKHTFIKDMLYTLNVVVSEVDVFKRSFEDITVHLDNTFLQRCRTVEKYDKDDFYSPLIDEYLLCKSSETADICIRRCNSLIKKGELKNGIFNREKDTTLRTDVISSLLICLGIIIIII